MAEAVSKTAGGMTNRQNQKSILRKAGIVLALLCCTVVPVSVSGTSDQFRGDDAQILEGSWDVTITTTPNPPFAIPFRILRTVGRSGVVDAYAFASITPTQGVINSAGHGSWARIGPRRFSVTVEYFQLNPAALLDKLDSIGKVRENIRVAKDGNSYVSVFETTIYRPDGTTFVTNSGQTEAKRIAVEPLPHNLP